MSEAPSTLQIVPTPQLSMTAAGQLRRRGINRQSLTGYLFLLPFVVVSALFFLLPLCWAAVLAFYQTSGPSSRQFVGMGNFRFILSDGDFYKALSNTGIFALASILLQLPLSLSLAMLLNAKDSRIKNLFRLIIFLPNLVGQVFVGVLFSILFTPTYGLFNRFLHSLVGWGLDQRWLDDPSLVMPAVIIASLWLYVGFNMIYFLAALQNVDQSLIEAARIDGAGPVRTFWTVTVPAIVPVATFVVVTSTIGSFQLFELPYTLLQQHGDGYGPRNSGMTIVGYLYQYSFRNGDLGTGAAVGWVLTLIILVVSLIQIRASSLFGSEK